MERKLCTIQKIKSLESIEGADFIELAKFEDVAWQVIVKKNEFKPGAACVYLEIDSFVPHSIAPFLTEKGHEPKIYNTVIGQRLRTKKMKGVLSQGLVLPLSISCLPNGAYNVGQDVTDLLGVVKYDIEQQDISTPPAKQSPIFKLLMRNKLFRITIGNKILNWKKGDKGGFPSHLFSKTDEERCISGDTLIHTKEYGRKTIKEIVDKKIKCSVLSYNVNGDIIEFKEVLDFNSKRNNNDWIKIITETGKELIITENHRVYMPELFAYREAKSLSEGDLIFVEN